MTSDSNGDDLKRSKTAWSPQAIVIGFVIAIAFVTVFVVLPLVRQELEEKRQATARALCISDLRIIGMALQSYSTSYQCYPPAFVADKDGKPAHSWAVLLLPFLGRPELTRLYEQYRFDEPWNGPSNRKLADTVSSPYACHVDRTPRSEADFVAVVGPQTAWRGTASLTPFQISDSIHDSIMLLEVGKSGIHRMEPRDLPFEQAIKGFAHSSGDAGIAVNHGQGISILSCDGSVQFPWPTTNSG